MKAPLWPFPAFPRTAPAVPAKTDSIRAPKKPRTKPRSSKPRTTEQGVF